MGQMTVVYNLCHGPGSHFYLLFDIRSSFYSAARLLNRILHFPFSKIGLGMFFQKKNGFQLIDITSIHWSRESVIASGSGTERSGTQ